MARLAGLVTDMTDDGGASERVRDAVHQLEREVTNRLTAIETVLKVMSEMRTEFYRLQPIIEALHSAKLDDRVSMLEADRISAAAERRAFMRFGVVLWSVSTFVIGTVLTAVVVWRT